MGVTADEVIVSVSGDWSDYNKASNTSTDNFEKNMADTVKAADTAEAAVAASFAAQAAAADTAAAKQVAANDRMLDSQRKKDLAQAAFILRAQRATEAYIANQDKEAKSAEAAAVRITAANNMASSGGRGAFASTGGSAASNGAFGRNLGGAGGTQNIAYQLQDFIVQVAAGQGVLRAFSQQAPQLLSGFGELGAVLGIGAAAVGLLAGSFGGLETAQDRAKAAQDSFAQAMKATKGALSESEQASLEYAHALSLVEQGQLNIARLTAENAIAQNAKTLKDSLSSLKQTAGSIGADIQVQLANLIDAAGGDGADVPIIAQLEKFQSKYQAVVDLVNKPNLTTSDFDKLSVLFQQLVTDGDALGLNVSQLRPIIATTAGTVKEYNDNQSILSTTLERTNALQGSWIELLRSLGFSIPQTAGQVNSLTGALDALLGSLFKVNQGTPSSLGNVIGPNVSAKYQEILNLNKGLDGTAAGNKKAQNEQKAMNDSIQVFNDLIKPTGSILQDLINRQRAHTAANDAYTKSLDNLNKVDAGQAGAKGGAAAQRQADAIDKTNLKIQQQIDMNTRLIAVYHDGEAARDKVKAQYDAENAARARNLDITSAQGKAFIAQYEQQAEALRASNDVVADYAKAQQITDGLATSQDKYNLTLATYVKYLGEGAFTTAQYTKAVKALNDSNDGYKEGIEAVGQAIQSGIQGATSFTDALVKVGLQLAQLLLQAALFGTGGLGKLFGSLTGLAGGLIGALGSGGGAGTTGALAAAGAALSLVPRASGGTIIPGTAYKVGEGGPETFVAGVPGTVIPNGAIGGGGNVTHDVKIQVTGTTDRELKALVAEASRAAYKQSLRDSPKYLADYNKRRA